MNRTLKRVLGLGGSVVLGIAGAVTFASAAQAHHSDYWGTSACNDDGTWTVTWEATDGTWPGRDGNLTATVQSWTVDGEVSGDLFTEGAALPAHGSTDTLKGTQIVPGDVDSVSLTLTSKWSNGVEDTGQPFLVSQPEGGCGEQGEPEPSYTIDSDVDCVGIWVWAENTNPEALAEFTFVSSDGEEERYTPEVEEGFGWYFYIEDAEAGLSVDIFVNDELVETVEWYDNELCSYVSVESDCEGLTFTLSVPEDGEETYFEIWTSTSEESLTYDIAPGNSEIVPLAIEGDEEVWVNYYIETPKDATYGDFVWTPCPPEESPSPSETPSAQPQLPTTGSSMTIMIGSAAALIVAAAAIFLFMRRRRAAQDW